VVSTTEWARCAAGGGRYARWQFQELIARRGVQVLQPDLIQVGGIWEARKIAAAAEPKGIAVAPHCPFGPISLAASFHLDIATPNFLVQEQTAMGDGMLRIPFRVDSGGYGAS
jgi:galactonate dehydratase